MSDIAIDALMRIVELIGAPVGCYPDCAKVVIYEERIRSAFEIARRVIVVMDGRPALPLPASSLCDS